MAPGLCNAAVGQEALSKLPKLTTELLITGASTFSDLHGQTSKIYTKTHNKCSRFSALFQKNPLFCS
jgi:hypothetical protein